MKFVINYYSVYSEYVINRKETTPGIKVLDAMRNAAGCDLPLDRIDDTIEAIKIPKIKIEISEETARKSGRFEETGYVEVWAESVLNNYLEPEFAFERDSKTNEIKRGTIKLKLNKEKVIEAWEARGFPMEWKQ